MAQDTVSRDDPILQEAIRIIAAVSGVAEDRLFHGYVIEAMFTDSIVKALEAAFEKTCIVTVGNPQPQHCMTIHEFLSNIKKIKIND